MKKEDLKSVLLKGKSIKGSGIIYDVQIKIMSSGKKAYFEPITAVSPTQIHRQLSTCLHDSRHNLKIKPCDVPEIAYHLKCSCGFWMNITKVDKKLRKATQDNFNQL